MSSISSSIVKVTALSGAYDDSPPSYLLQVDQFRFLLDCGWDEHYDVEKLSNLKKYNILYRVYIVVLKFYHGLHINIIKSFS